MKKALIFSLLTIFVTIVGCKKDASDPEGEYFLNITIDGNQVTWKSVVAELGPDLDNASYNNFGLMATSPDRKETFSFNFQQEDGAIVPGTYGSGDYFMPVDYIDERGSPMKLYGMQKSIQPYSVYSITITSITETLIKGTFQGNFLVNNHDNTEQVTITEGSFSARRIR